MIKKYTKTGIILLALVFTGSALGEGFSKEDIYRIIKEIDQLYRSNSSQSDVEMEIVTPHWQRTLVMDIWSKGTDKTFVRIREPKKEKGLGTLRIENEMWNYLPKTNKVIKVPPSMMMSSWMGSDFTNDDLVKEFSLFDDYTYKLAETENPEDGVVYIDCIPRPDLPIVWGNIVIAAYEDSHIPIWQKYYDEKGKLMRVMYYEDVKDFDGRKIPSVLEMIPQNKEGHKTVIRYKTIKFNLELKDDIFSLRNLRTYK
jgi:outer membrane lipoprotein-sorting protein